MITATSSTSTQDISVVINLLQAKMALLSKNPASAELFQHIVQNRLRALKETWPKHTDGEKQGL